MRYCSIHGLDYFAQCDACAARDKDLDSELRDTRPTAPTGQYLLRRQAKADTYVASLGINTLVSERDAFFAGWDKAIEEVGLMIQTPAGDGCYCAHHPDDPAHTATCYDVVDYLLLERSSRA